MFKRIWAILIAGVFIFGINKLSFAQTESIEHKHEDEHIEEEATAETGLEEGAVEVGNKICPVSGQKVKEEDIGKFQVEYEGKIYNLCCKMCLKDFKNDPEKYIRKLEELEEREGGHSGHEGHEHHHEEHHGH